MYLKKFNLYACIVVNWSATRPQDTKLMRMCPPKAQLARAIKKPLHRKAIEAVFVQAPRRPGVRDAGLRCNIKAPA